MSALQRRLPPEPLLDILAGSIAIHLDGVLVGEQHWPSTNSELEDPARRFAHTSPIPALLYASIQLRAITQKIIHDVLGIPLEQCEESRISRYATCC